jgi:DNA-binding transcriptional MerR regulator
MTEDLILETKEDTPNSFYAPSPVDGLKSEPEVDLELQKDLAKIPDKLAFKIGEVADITGLKSYVLRFWEGEFDQLKPKKSNQNQRAYTRKDVELVFLIKKLLYRDKFSIDGARKVIAGQKKDLKKQVSIKSAFDHFESLRNQATDLVQDIKRLRRQLS